ncbi:MAG: hypothetical protein WEE89_03600 [Gemmatimonadota bacterium]
MRPLVHGGSSAARLPGSLRAACALARETMVVMVRPKRCANSDAKEAELRAASIPYIAYNPIDHLNESVEVMTGLFDRGVTAGPNPVMVVYGVPLRTNQLKELKSLLRYRN